MTADGDDLPAELQDLIAGIEEEGLDPTEMAQRLRAVLDALPPIPGAEDTPLRRRLAAAADLLGG